MFFCSHSIYDLRQFCDEVIWLRDGRLAERGDPTHVTGEYFTFMRDRMDLAGAGTSASTQGLPTVRAIRILRMGTEEEVREITTGDSIEIRVEWEKPPEHAGDLNLGVGLVREDNVVCIGVGTHFERARLRGTSGVATLRLPGLPLLSGRYLVPVWLLDETGSHRFQETFPDHRLVVRATSDDLGVFQPRHEWVLRADSPSAIER